MGANPCCMTMLLMAAALAGAAPSSDRSYKSCLESTSTNTEWSRGGEAYLSRLDTALNAAWRKALASLDEVNDRVALRESSERGSGSRMRHADIG
jgi:uncharacterized protein YecT (DUF1311 family)